VGKLEGVIWGVVSPGGRETSQLKPNRATRINQQGRRNFFIARVVLSGDDE
jgi:hypothetical protein